MLLFFQALSDFFSGNFWTLRKNLLYYFFDFHRGLDKKLLKAANALKDYRQPRDVSKGGSEKIMDAAELYSLGIILVFAGVAVIMIALALLSIRASDQKGKVRGGGAIIIGFIPIVFGTDRESLKKMLLLSIVVVVVLAVVAILYTLFLW
jgi:uncharacterized protein (TIGR00304 family)